MANEGNLNFHQTFKPEKAYLSEIISIADMCQGLSIKEISKVTGIPTGESSGKVEPHIIYANYMGLINYEKKENLYYLKLTALGKIVKHEDIGLQEKITLLLCHCMIVRGANGAELWSYIFKNILPRYRYVVKSKLLVKELEQQYGSKLKMAPFNGSYLDIFLGLNMVEISTEGICLKKHQYNSEFIYLYAIVLYEYWNEIFAGQDEIASNQLEDIGFKYSFGWNNKEEYEVLEHLVDKGIIRMNRQLMPYTILRLIDEEEIIKRLYSELC